MARRVALAVLKEVDRGRRLDLAWDASASGLPPQERRWTHELVFGVERLRGRIDHLLGLHVHRGIGSVPVPLLRVLRLGAYQLLEMGSVPAYAAVSQTVTQASEEGGVKGAGLANAVLRQLGEAGGGPERFPTFDGDPVAHLSSWGSHPRWLVERWVERFGPGRARRIVEAGNRIPGLFARPVGISLEEGAERLARAGIRSEPGPDGSRTLALEKGADPTAVLASLPAVIQDPAASRVVEFVGVEPGQRVADLCAAPGGKGIGLAAAGARVFSLDLSHARVRLMREALARLALPGRVLVGRAERPPFPVGSMDAVLVDAPCTGTGTLARHPDARWRLTPDDPPRLAGVQEQILAGAAGLVREGGLLVYATCTLEAEENEAVVRAFLESRRDFAPDAGEAILQVFPGEPGTDGAFAARLRKRGRGGGA